MNRQINRRVRPVDDLAQYRTEDFWALPTARGGDCEDIALLKKRELMEQGFPGDRLLVATVFGKRVGAHAVLVVRLDDGDVVLDNMTDRIKPWHRTNYTFLRIQDPADPKSWARVSNRG